MGLNFKEKEKGFDFSCVSFRVQDVCLNVFVKVSRTGLIALFELQMNACLLKDIVLYVRVCVCLYHHSSVCVRSFSFEL